MGVDAQMFARYKGKKPTDEDIKRWSWDMCRALGANNFWINIEKGQSALSLTRAYDGEGEISELSGRQYHQDGDTIYAKDGEWFIEVNWMFRYYGKGYERGPWQKIVAVAEWLERNIGEVWYGGDSSGVESGLFDAVARKAMMDHACGKHGKDYFIHDKPGTFPTPEPCKLCVKDRAMNRYGWGANYVAVSCGGCGRSFTSRDNGKTWEVNKTDTY